MLQNFKMSAIVIHNINNLENKSNVYFNGHSQTLTEFKTIHYKISNQVRTRENYFNVI